MALFKLSEAPQSDDQVRGFEVYTQAGERVGTVSDALVDETGQWCYLVIETGFWIFGKKLLLPLDRASIDYSKAQVYLHGLDRAQAERLPEYNETMLIDRDYENQVHSIYYTASLETEVPLEASHALETSSALEVKQTSLLPQSQPIQALAIQPELPNLVERQSINPESGVVYLNEIDFEAGEAIQIELFEEVLDIQKQPFVYEEVKLSKELLQGVAKTRTELRREELEVHSEGNVAIDHTNQR